MLDYNKAKELFDYGVSIGQDVFYTPMYPEAVDICEKIGVNYYKIRFKDNNNSKLILKIWEINKPYFISCNNYLLMDHSRSNRLYCIPEYPADFLDYYDIHDLYYNGVSDHCSNTDLLEYCLSECPEKEYFEKHICLTKDCLESEWSVTFEQLEVILK